MATDIESPISSAPINNGTIVVGCNKFGQYGSITTYANNKPTIETIESKYDNRFYNGIFVNIVGDQTVIGG